MSSNPNKSRKRQAVLKRGAGGNNELQIPSVSFYDEAIPRQMRLLPQWVLWNPMLKDGRLMKIPYQRNGDPANTADPSTCTSYKRAVRAARQKQMGIGFVFVRKTRILGVDLDHCRNPDTGKIEPWAVAIIRRLNSYTEISPSGTGVHILLRGKLPRGRRKKGNIEAYETERYFTVTGRHLRGTPTTIEERTTELKDFHARDLGDDDTPEAAPAPVSANASVPLGDKEIVRLCRKAENSDKFDNLWRGDMSDYGGDESRADSALVWLLRFYTQDAKQLDRLFRLSGLMRPKWDQRRGDSTYGKNTIAKALASSGATYSGEAGPTGSSVSRIPDSGKRGPVKRLADAICTKHHFARDADGQLYVFEGGVYRPEGGDCVARLVKKLLERKGKSKSWSSFRAREVAEYIRVDAPALWERPPADTLNLQNGLLHIPTHTLRPHDPAHLCVVQLPVRYDPAATCRLWKQFIARVLPEDCHSLLFELIASAMRGDVSDQRAVLFNGPGATGKSTMLHAITSFLGAENVANLSLQRLEGDKFAVARLKGKLANVGADLSADQLFSSAMFKALTGGDRLTGEHKFQRSFEFIAFARLFCSSNHYVRSKDASDAFYRRWHVFPFITVIKAGDRIANLAAQLASPEELSGVLNQALAVLRNMKKRGGFSQSESTQKAMLEFRAMTDPVPAWLDQRTVVGTNLMVVRNKLLMAYNAHAQSSGRPPMTAKAFFAAVRRHRPTVIQTQRSVGGKVKWVFLGIGLNDSSDK